MSFNRENSIKKVIGLKFIFVHKNFDKTLEYIKSRYISFNNIAKEYYFDRIISWMVEQKI